MENIRRSYVIMLDAWLDMFPDQWPVSASKPTLDEIRQVDQHDGNPSTFPRADHQAERIEPKSLTHSQTGEIHSGAIFLLF